ncbi:helix-turn-helix domain-containing protein [Amycolatopsis aidingensis]|uniref:helix-turn-helix domain-containing protein n=1 Tax=Amycolatopsis aidingensis TaxID=2842453 RepID=UPI001E3DF5BA|nr:helix-turn-helix domain-containing protein [Amycolatopsis aidingensis]
MRDAFADRLRRLRRARGLSLSRLARLVHYSKGHLSRVENGGKAATPELALACDQALHAGGELHALVPGRMRGRRPGVT